MKDVGKEAFGEVFGSLRNQGAAEVPDRGDFWKETSMEGEYITGSVTRWKIYGE